MRLQRFVARIHHSSLSHREVSTANAAMLASTASQLFGAPVWMHQILLNTQPHIQSQLLSSQPLQSQQLAPARLAPGLKLPGAQTPAAVGRSNSGPLSAVLAAAAPPTAQPAAVAVAVRRQPPKATRDGNGPGVAPAAAAAALPPATAQPGAAAVAVQRQPPTATGDGCGSGVAPAAPGVSAVIDLEPNDGRGNAPMSASPAGTNPAMDPGITLQPLAAAKRLMIQKAALAHSREAATAAAAERLGLQKSALARSREAATAAPSASVHRGPEGNGPAAEGLLSLAAKAQSKPPETAPSPLQVAGAPACNFPTWSKSST